MGLLRKVFHDSCDSAVRYFKDLYEYQIRINELVRGARDTLFHHLGEEKQARRDLIKRFMKLAKSRNRYRRKYVILHNEMKKQSELIKALETSLISPSTFNNFKLMQRLRHVCPHSSKDQAIGKKAECRACGAVFSFDGKVENLQ
jgi:hypothetical protein